MLDRVEETSLWLLGKRKGLGLTQKAFAELLGMPESGERTVRGWENGEHQPSPAKLAQIGTLPDTAPFRSPYSENPGKADFSFIDLFAGIGGIRLPFQENGGHCVFTSEWDKFSKKTYAANFGEVPHGDLTKISAMDIPYHDVLLAGFPCQAFSHAGLKRGFNDTRGTLFFEIQKILAAKRPKAFLLENVRQLRSHDGGNTLQTILAILRGDW
ncbi:MAG: DNA (cytosine-5-)-methyltransferase, partial [Sulfitobacter sp.]